MCPPDAPVAPTRTRPTPTAFVQDPEQFRNSFLAMRPHFEALPSSQYVPLNIDVAQAASTVMNAAPAIQVLRAEFVRLPDFDITHVDRLPQYAQGTAYAHAVAIATANPVVPIGALRTELVDHRGRLFEVAVVLQKWGYFTPEQIDTIREDNGVLDPALDLFGLSKMFREAWDRVENQCPVTRADLDRADTLAQRYMLLFKEREQISTERAQASLDRVRAFSRMVRSYEAIQRGLDYIRREQDDADQIAPSLYAGRTGRRSVRAEDPEKPAAPGAPAAKNTVATPVSGPSPNIPQDDPFGRKG